MAKPAEFQKRRKIRYGADQGDVDQVFMLSTPVAPVLRYQQDQDGLSDLARVILEAIAKTAEWQFIRKLMLEHQPETLAGGEAGTEDPLPAQYVQKAQAAYQRSLDPEAESMHYSRPREAGSDVERFSRREQAHAQYISAYDGFNESRKAASERIAAHAMRHGTSYDEAAFDLGLQAPNVMIPPAVPV